MMENVNALASRHRHAHNNTNMMDEMDLFDGRTELRNKQGNVTICAFIWSCHESIIITITLFIKCLFV